MSFLSKVIIVLLLTFLIGFVSVQSVLAASYNLSGKISNSSGDAISGAGISVVDPNTNTTLATSTSDSSGNYNISIDSGTYNIHIAPPSGSNFSSAVASNKVISDDTILNFILVPAGSASLSGHVYDGLGNPVSNQRVSLVAGSTTNQALTDNTGNFSLQASTGTYELDVDNGATLNALSLNVPQIYGLSVYIIPGYIS
jgi:hypothetical protein